MFYQNTQHITLSYHLNLSHSKIFMRKDVCIIVRILNIPLNVHILIYQYTPTTQNLHIIILSILRPTPSTYPEDVSAEQFLGCCLCNDMLAYHTKVPNWFYYFCQNNGKQFQNNGHQLLQFTLFAVL